MIIWFVMKNILILFSKISVKKKKKYHIVGSYRNFVEIEENTHPLHTYTWSVSCLDTDTEIKKNGGVKLVLSAQIFN